MYKYTFAVYNHYRSGKIEINVRDNTFEGAKKSVEKILQELPSPWNVIENTSFCVYKVEEE